MLQDSETGVAVFKNQKKYLIQICKTEKYGGISLLVLGKIRTAGEGKPIKCPLRLSSQKYQHMLTKVN